MVPRALPAALDLPVAQRLPVAQDLAAPQHLPVPQDKRALPHLAAPQDRRAHLPAAPDVPRGRDEAEPAGRAAARRAVTCSVRIDTGRISLD